ncbi:hypothetical protein [Ruegeria sp. ANG-R]|uniref:hypothetical protein n=1 Tax=Ruegeria sp. ANG-R TaxID=1577903 RepID=UPI00068F67AF|nr:hypothetical protein [Ruegeria sp. ANG-R]
MIKQIALICSASAILSACGSSWSTSNVSTNKLEVASASISPDDVTITSAGDPGRQYTKITDLKVTVNKTTAFHPSPTPELVIAKLKEEAAAVGANAVINTKISEVHITPLSWGSRTGTGEAVKFIN